MAQIVLAGVLGVAFGILQLLLMRRVIGMRGPARVLLLIAKIPLWAVGFIGVALWWGVGPLIAFGLAAGGLYVAAGIIYYVRNRPEHLGQKGE